MGYFDRECHVPFIETLVFRRVEPEGNVEACGPAWVFAVPSAGIAFDDTSLTEQYLGPGELVAVFELRGLLTELGGLTNGD